MDITTTIIKVFYAHPYPYNERGYLPRQKTFYGKDETYEEYHKAYARACAFADKMSKKTGFSSDLIEYQLRSNGIKVLSF